MTDDSKKKNKTSSNDSSKALESDNQSHEVIESVNDLSLSANPFSEDYEVTQLEQKFDFDPKELLDDKPNQDEVTEVTEKSFVKDLGLNSEIQTKELESSKKKKKFRLRHQKEEKSHIKKISPQTKKWLRYAGVTLLAIVVLTILAFYVPPTFLKTKPNAPKTNPQKFPFKKTDKTPKRLNYGIRLSSLQILGPAQKPNTRISEVEKGETLKISFLLDDWNTQENEKLNFHVEVRIFDEASNLIHYLPNFKNYTAIANAKEHQIQIKGQVKVLSAAPPGVYRLQFKVVDSASNRGRTLQTRFQVLSRKRR